MDETLQFVSDNVFAKMAPSPRATKPLEWRRRFNFLRLDVGSLTLETIYQVNEVDLLGKAESTAAGSSCVRPDTKTTRRIRGVALQDDMRDTLLRTVLAGPGSDIFKLKKLGGDISVTIVDTAPREDGSEPGEASYPGVLLSVDIEGNDAWALELSIPSSQMDDLVRSLRGQEINTITAGISVQSFTDEVDDALRDWNDRRRIFIHGDAAAAPCHHLLAHKRQPPPSGEDPDRLEHREPAPVSVPATVTAPLMDYKAALASIKVALWAIAALEFLKLLK